MDMDTANEVKVMESPPPIRIRSNSEELEHEARRKRRRKIRRMAQRAKGFPSFYKLLTADYTISDDELEDESECPDMVPSKIVSQSEPIIPTPVASLPASSTDVGASPTRLRININARLGLQDEIAIRAEGKTGNTTVGLAAANAASSANSLLEDEGYEGYYEGVLPMSMDTDTHYLPPQQVWIRQQLEFFSAAPGDSSTVAAGRRPTNRGRVGVRCKHCRAAREGASAQKPWPGGAVSYPTNLGSVYITCTQKPTLHFEKHCVNLPSVALQEWRHIQQAERSTRRAKGGLSASTYYVVAAKQCGLTDTVDGIRFARDLSLEPLPLETIKQQLQVQVQQQVEDAGTPVPSAVISSTATAPQTRLTADEESERVLAQAVAKSDDDGSLCTADKKTLITDYIFLTMQQMKLCYALPDDLSSRGKKSKLVRVGLAGYCCRHCEGNVSSIPSARSFPSAAANLVSSIANSFAVHLQKCPYVPLPILNALSVYKRLHSRQMAQLPYGSQRRFMDEFWDLLRSKDKSEEEMEPILANLPVAPVLPPAPPRCNITVNQRPPSRKRMRNVAYPTCDDSTCKAILDAAQKDWDPTTNDHLIRPEDRDLVSDYVFLTMRQLQAVPPSHTARVQLFGLSCIHCHEKEHQTSPSGRSFPSAPDNYASALNTGFYNHLQNCIYVPADLKQVLAATRKIHSSQCSSLPFGAQRKYFNLLFKRLQALDVSSLSAIRSGEDSLFGKHGFLNISTTQQPYWVCQRCNGVPMIFRAPGSVWFQTPTADAMPQHEQNCKADQWDLRHVALLLKEVLEERSSTKDVGATQLSRLIEAATGNTSCARYLAAVLLDALETESYVIDPPSGLDDCIQSTHRDSEQLQEAFNEFTTGVHNWTGEQNIFENDKLLAFLGLFNTLFTVPETNKTSDEVQHIEDGGRSTNEEK